MALRCEIRFYGESFSRKLVTESRFLEEKSEVEDQSLALGNIVTSCHAGYDGQFIKGKKFHLVRARAPSTNGLSRVMAAKSFP